MQKPFQKQPVQKSSNKVNIADHNLYQFGGALEHNIKHAAAEHEHAWTNCGKADGLEIWRVHSFKLVDVPLTDHGKFYDGDSYIILRTKKVGTSFKYDTHFWLGLETSQDEAGTAAYKTVELDDHLNGTAVQHREVQGHESDLFKSYFPKGLFILHGGFESGFHHVSAEKEFSPRLLEVTGDHRHAVVNEVSLNVSSINSANAYILDLGLIIIQFVGKKANITERGKCAQVAQSIYDDRGAKAHKFVVTEGDDDENAKKFWQALGHDEPQAIAQTGTSRVVAHVPTKELFKIHEDENTHELTFTSIAKGDAVKKSLLKSNDAFALDLGNSVFVWVGAKATQKEKRNGLMVAQQYVTNHSAGRNPHTRITRVVEGHESEEFIASIY